MIASCLIAAAGASAATPTTNPAFQIDSAFRGGGTLTGEVEKIAAPPMKERWTYKTSDEDRAGVLSSPAIAGDTAYIADNRGTLHALDLKTGQLRWKYASESGFETTPLVAGGRIFIGDLAGIFHAVSAKDGAKVWTVNTDASIHSSANAAGDRILFGNDAAEMYCLNAADGAVIWKATAGDRINSAPSIANGLAYFSGCDGELRAIDIATGREKFTFDMEALAAGSAVVAGDRIVVGTDGGRVLCLSSDGKQKHWSYDQVEREAMVYSTPAVADGIVVVGARDRQIHAIDLATGKRLWVVKTRGDVDASPIISDGRAYVASRDKRLYVLDLKTGNQLWEFLATRGIEAGPAIGAGVLVLADTAGMVYCLEPQKPH